MIAFSVEEGKVRFEINEEAARRDGLKIDSKLLVLAKAPGRRNERQPAPVAFPGALDPAQTHAAGVLTSTLALLLASCGFMVFDLIDFRSDLARESR